MVLRFDSIKTILLEKLIEYLDGNFLVFYLLSQFMDIHISVVGGLLYAFFKFEELHHLFGENCGDKDGGAAGKGNRDSGPDWKDW